MEATNKKKWILAGAAALCLIAAGIAIFFGVRAIAAGESRRASASPTASPAAVNSNVVTGTGVIEAKEQYDITALVTGTILSAPFEEGQQINAGDLLYQIDAKDIQSSIEKSQVAVEKSQLAYNQTADNVGKLTVRSPISGTVTQVYVREGDTVSAANNKIAEIIDDSRMLLKVPFLADSAAQIYEGAAAQVTVTGSFYSTSGTVTRVGSGNMVTPEGSAVRIVEIRVDNPGAIKKDDKATAVVGSIACNDAGSFDYSEAQTVSAEGTGTCGPVAFKVGDHISAGSALVTLENSSLTSSQQQNSLAIKEARLGLKTQQEQLDKYRIKSPISGTVITKNAKQGDNLSAASAGMGPLATVADLSQIKFKMEVDELDVPRVQHGQQVLLAADALPGQQYFGTVESIDDVGKDVNGVALFQVTVVVENPDGLKPGMNVNAQIQVDRVEGGEFN